MGLFKKRKKQAASPPPESQSESLTILPRIKADYSHELYKGDESKAFTGNPMPEGIDLPADQMPIIKPLYEDLTLCFAVDKGDHYELLQQHILDKNPHLSLDALHQACVAALINEIGQNIQVHGDPNAVLMVTAGGNFEAAIILLDNFWEQIHGMVGGNLIVSLPARDLLFVCAEQNDGAVEQMKGIIRDFYEKPDASGHLSKGLYLRRKGQSELKLVDRAF